MARFLLTGDQHLGKGQDLGRVPGERLAEQESVWAATLALSRDRRCDALLHAGDLFDGRRPTPDVMLAAERPLVEHQAQGGCDVYMIAGNHDVPSQDGPCGLDVLAEAGLIWLARDPQSFTVAPGVRVCCLPWTPLARLVAADNGQTERAEIAAVAADLLVQTARDMHAGQGVEILLGHWAVSDTVLPSGLSVTDLREVVLPMADLQAIGYEQIVFGHIHSPQQVGRFLYVGSPQQLDFGDCGSQRGAWVWDDSELEFVPLPSRRFVTVGLGERTLDVDGAFVKVRATVTEEEHRRLDLTDLRQELELVGAHTVVFDLTVERARRDRGVVLDDTMTPADQLAAYLQAAGVNGSLGARMLERAGGYLS